MLIKDFLTHNISITSQPCITHTRLPAGRGGTLPIHCLGQDCVTRCLPPELLTTETLITIETFNICCHALSGNTSYCLKAGEVPSQYSVPLAEFVARHSLFVTIETFNIVVHALSGSIYSTFSMLRNTILIFISA